MGGGSRGTHDYSELKKAVGDTQMAFILRLELSQFGQVQT